MGIQTDGFGTIFQSGVTVTHAISPGNLKSLTSGVPVSLLQIDASQTITPPLVTADNTFACKVFFAAECTDGVDAQIRQGDCNAGVALKSGVWTTSQAVNASNAITGGTLIVAFSWLTSGNIATLQVTVTTSLIAPADFQFHYFVLHATHPKFTYV